MQTAQTDANDFADVLIAMGKASRVLPRIESELNDVQTLMQTSQALRQFVADPRIQDEGKRSAVQELIGGDCHPALVSFLCYLVDANQLPNLDRIARHFFEKVSIHRKEASGEVVSAVHLAPEKVSLIEHETGRLLGKKVTLRSRVDPEILAGIYVRVGDFVVDGTLDRQLDMLRHALLS